MRKLTVEDILDSRAYERERDAIRGHVIGLKRTRRVALGPIMSMVFENTETMRWQVQEMARAERMLRDEEIAHEVETYNQLIPDVGELSATLLLELTSELALREWLPRLVGIERSAALVLADGSRVRGSPNAEDEARLTRDVRRTSSSPRNSTRRCSRTCGLSERSCVCRSGVSTPT
jgi:hypothetical protein